MYIVSTVSSSTMLSMCRLGPPSAALWNGFNENYWNKITYFKLDFEQMIDPSQVTSSWSENFRALVSSSPYFGEIIENIIRNSYQKSLNLTFAQCKQFHSSRDYNNYEHQFVLGSTLVSQISRLKTQSPQNVSFGAVIPTARTITEVKTTECPLQNEFFQIGNGSLVASEDTWRAFVRHPRLLSPTHHCLGDYYYSIDRTKIAKHEVILIFKFGITNTWSAIESHMDHMVGANRKIVNSTLKTLAFYEDDLLVSTKDATTRGGYEAENNQIINFIRKWDQQYSTGCVIKFTEERLENLMNDKNLVGGSFKEKASKFCEPIFDIVDVIIWDISNDTRFSHGYSGKHDNILVTRDIFLKEYPNKEVFIRFDYLGNDKDKPIYDVNPLHKNFANFNGITLIV